MTRTRRPLACHHEAGHAVARRWLGFHSDDVAVLTLDDLRTIVGETKVDPMRAEPNDASARL